MTWPPAKNITAWSFSRYSTYKQCPLKLKLSAIDRIKEPASAPMERGDAIHKLAQAYLNGDKKTLPKELAPVADEVRRLRAIVKNGVATVEDNWAFRQDWTATTWDDWAKCWVRIKLDLAHFETEDLLVVTDWKSGKFRPDNLQEYLEQIDLYKLGALLTFSHVKGLKVIARLIYTDHGIYYPPIEEGMVAATAHDLPRLKREWEKRVKPMMKDATFAPKPNKFCYSCHYRASNKAAGGGQCKY